MRVKKATDEKQKQNKFHRTIVITGLSVRIEKAVVSFMQRQNDKSGQSADEFLPSSVVLSEQLIMSS